jgi:hypothetical protein
MTNRPGYVPENSGQQGRQCGWQQVGTEFMTPWDHSYSYNCRCYHVHHMALLIHTSNVKFTTSSMDCALVLMQSDNTEQNVAQTFLTPRLSFQGLPLRKV